MGKGNDHGPLTGGVSNASGLVRPDCPFLILFGAFPIFRDFPDLSGDGPPDFPDLSFSSCHSSSTYEEQSRVRDTIRAFPEKQLEPPPPVWETPGLATPKVKFRSKSQFAVLFPRQLHPVTGQTPPRKIPF